MKFTLLWRTTRRARVEAAAAAEAKPAEAALPMGKVVEELNPSMSTATTVARYFHRMSRTLPMQLKNSLRLRFWHALNRKGAQWALSHRWSIEPQRVQWITMHLRRSKAVLRARVGRLTASKCQMA